MPTTTGANPSNSDRFALGVLPLD
jgi:hypothetical protein